MKIIDRRALRKKLGSRSSRRQGTKSPTAKVLKPRPRVGLAKLIQAEQQKKIA